MWCDSAHMVLRREREGLVSGTAFEFLVSEDPVIIKAIDRRTGDLWPDLRTTIAHVFTTPHGTEFVEAFFRRARAAIDSWNTRFHVEVHHRPEEDLWDERFELRKRWVERAVSLVDAVGALCSESEMLVRAVTLSDNQMSMAKSARYQAYQMDALLLTTLGMCGCAQEDIEAAKEVVINRFNCELTRGHATDIFDPTSSTHKSMVNNLIKPVLEG